MLMKPSVILRRIFLCWWNNCPKTVRYVNTTMPMQIVLVCKKCGKIDIV